MDLRFVDYKCKDCENITEVVIKGDNDTHIKCSKCGSKNMVRVFSSVGVKTSTDSGEGSYSGAGSSSSCGGCMGGDCSTCSGSR